MLEIKKHYYIHKGKRYENQKEACMVLGIGRHAFRGLVKKGDITKKIIKE
ncbi:hypothetical protein [Tenacibaculum dicentrarchi]